MVTTIDILFSVFFSFVLITVGSYLGTMLALRAYHENEEPSIPAAADILHPGKRNRD